MKYTQFGLFLRFSEGFKEKHRFNHQNIPITVSSGVDFRNHKQFEPLIDAVALVSIEMQSKIGRLQHLQLIRFQSNLCTRFCQ